MNTAKNVWCYLFAPFLMVILCTIINSYIEESCSTARLSLALCVVVAYIAGSIGGMLLMATKPSGVTFKLPFHIGVERWYVYVEWGSRSFGLGYWPGSNKLFGSASTTYDCVNYYGLRLGPFFYSWNDSSQYE